jgi:23S rRNA (pseudouridine1915-N3)-methyltransferase
MQLTVAHIGARTASGSKTAFRASAKSAGKSAAKDSVEALVQTYLERCSAFARCQTESFKSEDALLEWLSRQQGRTPALAVLLDSRGRQMSSEGFASWLGARRDDGAQHIVLAIGPADGWSEAARHRAQLLLSLGPMTLAHSLARLVLSEQIYRAFTILTGHPYHGGH